MDDENEQLDVLAAANPGYPDEPCGLPADDPLTAIKKMRLAQLSVCRLRSEQEMQAMGDELSGIEDDGAEP